MKKIFVLLIGVVILTTSCSSGKDICRTGSKLKFEKKPSNGYVFNHPRVKK